MASQETNVTNRAESTLSGSLGIGATTINVTDTSAFPAVPFYCAIDPDVDAKAEIVLVDSAKAATTLTLSGAGQRGQDGTSDVAHDSGAKIAVVPVAALWTDINDRVDASNALVASHDHDGTGDVQIATSNLTGHTKAAHDALGIDAATLDAETKAQLRARSSHTGTQAIATLSDHDKAAHDALALDHGSLGGLTDGDHPQYAVTAQATGPGGVPQSITAGVETTLLLTATDWASGASLATNTLTATYGGLFRVHATVSANFSSAPSSGTFRLKLNGVTELSDTVTISPDVSGTIGSSALSGSGVATVTLAAADDLTLTLQLTGGAGHEAVAVLLYIERIG